MAQPRLSLYPVPISKATLSNPRNYKFRIVAYVRSQLSYTSINLTRHGRLIDRIHPSSALHRPCFYTFHYKCIKPLIEAHHPAFFCPLCRTYADLEEDVEVEPTDLDDADDADVEIDDAAINKEFADAANQSNNAGISTAAATPTSRPIDSIQHRHGEDAEMSDGSSNTTPLSRPALPPIPVASGRLLPTTERDQFHLSVDRDRQAGEETEVDPDSVGQLSLSSRRVRGAGTGGGGVSRARERARNHPALLSAGAGEECTEDEGISGAGVAEVDEVEMGDAIE